MERRPHADGSADLRRRRLRQDRDRDPGRFQGSHRLETGRRTGSDHDPRLAALPNVQRPVERIRADRAPDA